jgi:ABC-type uncharacterized transport system permease subunit
MDITQELLIIAGAFALAFLTEAFVEYFIGQVMDKFPKLSPFKWLLMYISAVVGVGLSLFYKLDLISLIIQQDITIVGMVLTGMAIGRGSNFLHQFVSQFFPAKK